jgi:hypothetical protein
MPSSVAMWGHGFGSALRHRKVKINAATSKPISKNIRRDNQA